VDFCGCVGFPHEIFFHRLKYVVHNNTLTFRYRVASPLSSSRQTKISLFKKKIIAKRCYHNQDTPQKSPGEKCQKLGNLIKPTSGNLMKGSVEKPDLVYLKPDAL